MNNTIAYLGIAMGALQLTGCVVLPALSVVDRSIRMEDARTKNAGKQLVPIDGGTYLIAVGTETASLVSGRTDWKVGNTDFSQPRGTYSVVRVRPGTYAVYGNRYATGGGTAASSIEIKEGEAVCFYFVEVFFPPSRMETKKGDACDPILRPLQNQNVIGEVK